VLLRFELGAHMGFIASTQEDHNVSETLMRVVRMLTLGSVGGGRYSRLPAKAAVPWVGKLCRLRVHTDVRCTHRNSLLACLDLFGKGP